MSEKTSEKKIIDQLNRMLEQEHACAIRYETHASVVTGPYAESVSARLKEIAGDEREHAAKLRGRITALGGTPSMQVSREDLKPARTLDEIIKINIAEEQGAIRGYTEILEGIDPKNAILYLSIQEIIRDEQEHLEELQEFHSV
jgi:bacterioferritin (cytochrome b1)